ncbi:MAG: SLC13/DASS family transporter [Acidaminococcaceae bacterium]|uniref:SLC13 family permease n=1 Tax=Succiniclasticum sp. TaxID=2775030 RepID=UPI000E875004|nr:SLC13 family permease [Succiniclasticum sp.]MBO5589776.1 SLC13/DASS family transporter [Acidaminococcaceae bacterium]MBO5635894.1 SLC13/DASS family transporter [Acidaminococcaceae bacterium]MBP3812380.1 SLC13/DASS family transporter [Acidaminococcaceae bacterium]MBR1495908.1 SLC13/DASS family transporter [Acidaminococcaceae bacterium]MDY6291176.1 SLC13 family permease [Succiniclasticum sp.]
MAQSTKCLILLAVIALFFITEIIPLAITATAGAIACGLLGFIPTKQVFSGLSNSTVVLFAGMFIVGAAMFYTGLAQKIGESVVKITGNGENSLMIGLFLVGAGLSSVLSNTGTAACLLPVALGVCAAAKIPASRELMPLAFACGVGGIITLVGTPPNIIAAGALGAAGFQPFGFFEFAKIGIPLTIAALLYMMFLGKYLLPKKELDADQEIEQEIEANQTSTTKMIISGVILLVVVLVMALGIKGISLEMAAITGALVCVLTGCLTEKQAYASIDWVTIFLFAGMMPVSTALDKTGAGKVIAEWAVGLMGGSPSPMVVTIVLFILSCGLTQFMSNTASAALLCPIGIAISKQLGASPHAVLMAIAVAASCAFATPVGTPPNTLVLGPGGYKFMDYVKCGTGLVIVCFIVSVILIPMFWPFFPG